MRTVHLPVETLVHVMVGIGSPCASQCNLAVLSAGNDTVLMCGPVIFGLDRTIGIFKNIEPFETVSVSLN